MNRGFAVPAFNAGLDLIGWNESDDIVFNVPDAPGTYEYICRPHRLMARHNPGLLTLVAIRDRRISQKEEKQLLDAAIAMNRWEHRWVGPLMHARIIGANETCCRLCEMLLT